LTIYPRGAASDARRQPLRSRKGVLRARGASSPCARDALRTKLHQRGRWCEALLARRDRSFAR
jgi:hypothetical protein